MLDKHKLAQILAEKAKQGGMQPNQHVAMGGSQMASQPMGPSGMPNHVQGQNGPHMGMPIQAHPMQPSGLHIPQQPAPGANMSNPGIAKLPSSSPSTPNGMYHAKFPKLSKAMKGVAF